MRHGEVVERTVRCFRANGVVSGVDMAVSDECVVGGFDVDAVGVWRVEVSVYGHVVDGDRVGVDEMQAAGS